MLKTGEQIPLTLDGIISPNAAIRWETSAGTILFTPPGLSAMFTAPPTPQIAIITVTLSSGTPGNEIPITRNCTIMPQEAIPTPSIGPNVASNVANPTSDVPPTIAITEVMSNPCGGDDFKKWNQYVELYNYGDTAVDVRGWWLYDPGENGTPDSLVSWAERVVGAPPGTELKTNTTIIPPHGFAVILSPYYVEGVSPHRMPYVFPPETVILSIRESQRLGDDVFGIVGTGLEPDFLVLYIGGSNSIQQVVSTYGDPIRGRYLQQFQDTPRDGLPLENLPECWSAEKIEPAGPDEYKNWYALKNGSPGQAAYR